MDAVDAEKRPVQDSVNAGKKKSCGATEVKRLEAGGWCKREVDGSHDSKVRSFVGSTARVREGQSKRRRGRDTRSSSSQSTISGAWDR